MPSSCHSLGSDEVPGDEPTTIVGDPRDGGVQRHLLDMDFGDPSYDPVPNGTFAKDRLSPLPGGPLP